LAHGQSLSFTTFGCKCNQCTSWTYGEVCMDGNLRTNYYPPEMTTYDGWWRNYSYGASGIEYSIYDPTTNAITSTHRINAGLDWGVFFDTNDIQGSNYSEMTRKAFHINRFNQPARLVIRNWD